MSGISDVNPFVGPRPIQVGEALYGRNTEVRELYNQLKARRVVVLHSPSGAGKSSLVHAGLIPKLREGKFDVWKPIRVNLDATSFEGVPADANRYILSALVSLEDEIPAKRRRSPAELAKLGFLEYLETRPRRKSRARHSVVLLFDQFEEVLSVDPRNVEAKEAFFAAVGEALDTDKYWALFIIREDYLAALAPYRDQIPTQMLNTFRIDLLGLDGAREAAVKLAEKGGREFPAVDKLIRDLSVVQVQHADGTFTAEQGLHVEPVYLQVVCRRLWDAMPADDLSIDEEDIAAYAEVSESLADYYSGAVRAIAGDDAGLERKIRDWVGTKLISGGIRSQIRQEAGSSAGLDNEHIERLLDSYLVRTEQRAGANWFELSHDRLVEPVLESNEDWQQQNLHALQVQAKLWEDGGRSRALLLGTDALPGALTWARDNPRLMTASEREFLDLSKGLADEQLSRRRRQRLFMVALSGVAVVAVGFGIIALQAQQKAQYEEEEARIAQKAAETAAEEAEKARAEAVDAQLEAEASRKEAERSSTEAVKAKEENERAVRQMFEVSLRRFVAGLAKNKIRPGVIEVDERWTPLLERHGQVIVAATVGEPQRFVVAGHESILTEVDENGVSPFLEITAQWLLADQARRKVAIVTRDEGKPRLKILTRNLLALELEYFVNPDLEALESLADAGMLIIDNREASAFSERKRDTIQAFIDRGGGVLAIGTGAAWLSSVPPPNGVPGPPPSLDDYPMNGLMKGFGARWTKSTIDPEELAKRQETAIVRFENKTGAAVNLLTRSAEVEKYYTTLEVGEVRELLTILGQEWVFRDAEDKHLIGAATIADEEQTLAISAGMAKAKAKAKPKPRPSGSGDGDGDGSKPTDLPKPPKPGQQLPEILGPAELKAGLDAAKKASRECGKLHDTIMPSVRVQLTIAPGGEVTSASATGTMKGTPEGSCAAEAVKGLRFPKSRKGVEITWKLPLSP